MALAYHVQHCCVGKVTVPQSQKKQKSFREYGGERETEILNSEVLQSFSDI